jgi:hypothetical protein
VGPSTPLLEEVGPRDHAGDRHARGNALGGQEDVGLDVPLVNRPHRAGPPDAGLDLVGDEQDPVAVADLAEARHEAVLGDDVAALALDRLDDDCGDFRRRNELVEEDLVEPLEALDRPERRVVDARQERPEVGVVLGLRGGQADRAVRPAVEGAQEGDDVRAPVA